LVWLLTDRFSKFGEQKEEEARKHKKKKKKKKSSFVCVFIPSCLGFGIGVGLVFTYYSLVSLQVKENQILLFR
jgi:cell division septal protein FtsQ